MHAPSGSYFEQCINMHFSLIIPLAFSSGVVPLGLSHYIAPGPQPLVYLKFFLLSSLNIWEHTHTLSKRVYHFTVIKDTWRNEMPKRYTLQATPFADKLFSLHVSVSLFSSLSPLSTFL